MKFKRFILSLAVAIAIYSVYMWSIQPHSTETKIFLFVCSVFFVVYINLDNKEWEGEKNEKDNFFNFCYYCLSLYSF